MTDRELRDLPRFDYKVLGTSGGTVILDQVPRSSTPTEGLSDDNSSNSGPSGSGSEESLDRTLVAEANNESEVALDQTLNQRTVYEPEETVVDDQEPRFSLQDSSSDENSSSSSSGEPSEIGSVSNLTQTAGVESEVHLISQSLENISLSEMDLIKLQSLEETLRYDITDYIDENPTDRLLAVEDIDSCVSKMEDLRSRYRNAHTDLRRLDKDEYDDKYGSRYEKMMKMIKEHISSAKEIKNDIRNMEVQASATESYRKEAKAKNEADRNASAAEFLFAEIDRQTRGIADTVRASRVSSDKTILDDDELVEMRKQFPVIQQRIDTVADKFKELLGFIPSHTDLRRARYNTLANRLDQAVKQYDMYMDLVKKEIRSRELSKEKAFKSSTLKISIPKFSGYDSPLDYYTFKDKFIQLYSNDVPLRAMPELLKNNYLVGPALDAVKRLDTIDEIWANLKKEFGDPRIMLQKKLGELESMGTLGRVREAEKVKDGLNKVVNVIRDLMRLAEDHGIEQKLYNGDGVYAIYKIIGEAKVTKFIERTCEAKPDGRDLWSELLKFLEKDIKVQLEKSLIYRVFPDPKSKSDKESKKPDGKSNLVDNQTNGDTANLLGPQQQLVPTTPTVPGLTNALANMNQGGAQGGAPLQNTTLAACFICKQGDHVATKGPYGKKFVQYFSCRVFVESCPADRFQVLKKLGFCIQCLFPGALSSSGKHVDGKCQDTYVCKHDSHASFTIKKHVLVCEEHKDTTENKALLEEYRKRCINRKCNAALPEFSRTIQLSFHCSHITLEIYLAGGQSEESGVYMLQWIKVNGQSFLVFFDSGCNNLLITKDAQTRLGLNAKQIYDGTVTVGGVSGFSVESRHGACQISLPMYNGKNAVMSGLVIDKITEEFPTYPLDQVEKDIHNEYRLAGGNVADLPRLPESIGHHVDIMIGAATYNRYFPTEVFRCESGLSINKSLFCNLDGSRGVVVGPHKSFTAVDRSFFSTQKRTQAFVLTKEAQMFKILYQNEKDYFQDMKLEQVVCEKEDNDAVCMHDCNCTLLTRSQKTFDEVENAGSQITYRCVKCRNCQGCKSGERVEMISTRAEVEQVVVKKSVVVDREQRKTIVSLPFIEDPVKTLSPNREIAMQVYKSQVRRLNKDPQAKADVLASHEKLRALGFVDKVKNCLKNKGS